MHNVHQNQGDPVGSQRWGKRHLAGRADRASTPTVATAFISKFTSQSYKTDAQGHRPSESSRLAEKIRRFA